MPCPVRRWDRELSRLFYPVCWDRSLHPPRRLGGQRAVAIPEKRVDSDKGAEMLLALLAPAIRIEPALLRAVRYLLPAREADVGSEAWAWNHEDVHATPLAFYYDKDAIPGYRAAFKQQERGLRGDVGALILAHHRHLAPTIGIEEKQLLANLNGTIDDQARRDMERMAATLRRGEGTLVDAGRAWVQRWTPRQHKAMWNSDPVAAVWVAANLSRLREKTTDLPEGLDLSRVAWLLGEGRTVRSYALRQRGQALCFEPAGEAAVEGELDAPGSLMAEVRAAVPTVQVDIVGGGTFSRPLDGEIPLASGGQIQLRTDHDELTIGSTELPDWAEAIGRDEYGLYADFAVEGVSQRMRWIAPGEFLMGSPENEPERYSDETQHPVILTRGYWLADTVCTQALWRAVMGSNPSNFKGDDRPVEQVSWEDAQYFIERLNGRIPGNTFRLPTEAEWEYACRAGTTGPFWFGDQITTDQVNYDGNRPYAGSPKGQDRGETVNVKDLPCNGWGLYQMHGNVWEWCQDWLGGYDLDTIVDPAGPAEGSGRVLRGGGWVNDGGHVRSAYRLAYVPGLRYGYCGFRLARGQASGQPAPEAGIKQEQSGQRLTNGAERSRSGAERSAEAGGGGIISRLLDFFRGNRKQ